MTFATAHDDGLPPALGSDRAVLDIAVIGSGISGLWPPGCCRSATA